jgi:MSHA pilin protein MshD
MCMNKPSRRQSGFTLIELIIFIVIVSVSVAGILLVMNTVVASSADPLIRKQALALAESVMEEILQKNYDDPDGLPNVVEANRTLYDDVDDYNGLTNAAFIDLPAALNSYVIAIVVAAPAALNGVQLKRVTVNVTHGPEIVTVTGYRGNY